MSLFGPEYFKCKHEKLNKKKIVKICMIVTNAIKLL